MLDKVKKILYTEKATENLKIRVDFKLVDNKK